MFHHTKPVPNRLCHATNTSPSFNEPRRRLDYVLAINSNGFLGKRRFNLGCSQSLALTGSKLLLTTPSTGKSYPAWRLYAPETTLLQWSTNLTRTFFSIIYPQLLQHVMAPVPAVIEENHYLYPWNSWKRDQSTQPETHGERRDRLNQKRRFREERPSGRQLKERNYSLDSRPALEIRSWKCSLEADGRSAMVGHRMN